MAATVVLIDDALEGKSQFRKTLNFVDDDGQARILGLIRERLELIVWVLVQCASDRIVVQRHVGGRLQDITDQGRFPVLPGTNDVYDPTVGKGILQARGEMARYKRHGTKLDKTAVITVAKQPLCKS